MNKKKPEVCFSLDSGWLVDRKYIDFLARSRLARDERISAMDMKSSFLAGLVTVGLLGVCNAGAQQVRTDGDSYVAETAAKAGCRAAVLHIVRSGNGLSGVVFFKDGSGVSSVNGQSDGTSFKWMMASVRGAGPVGEVTGSVTPEGALHAQLTGSNCTLDAVLQRYRDIYNGSG